MLDTYTYTGPVMTGQGTNLDGPAAVTGQIVADFTTSGSLQQGNLQLVSVDTAFVGAGISYAPNYYNQFTGSGLSWQNWTTDVTLTTDQGGFVNGAVMIINDNLLSMSLGADDSFTLRSANDGVCGALCSATLSTQSTGAWVSAPEIDPSGASALLLLAGALAVLRGNRRRGDDRDGAVHCRSVSRNAGNHGIKLRRGDP